MIRKYFKRKPLAERQAVQFGEDLTREIQAANKLKKEGNFDRINCLKMFNPKIRNKLSEVI